MKTSKYRTAVLLQSLAVASLIFEVSSQSTNTTSGAKRGLVYISTSYQTDYNIFTRSSQPSTPLTWYYNYSPYPSLPGGNDPLTFVPMIHGTNNAAADVSAIQSLGSSITHVLTYNEPDGTTSSGGSDISPRAAAQTYLNTIAPLRSAPYNLKVGLPATTGSPMGLDWLSRFNQSRHSLHPKGGGCQFDFLAAHWYGEFAGMASWLGQLHGAYPGLPIWLTEFALPQASSDATLAFLNQSLAYLDGLEYVEKYAWFGTFRSSDANEWTGDDGRPGQRF